MLHLRAVFVVVAGTLAVSSAEEFRYVPNEAFGFGERLEFRVGYKFITAGRAYFQIGAEPVYREGRPCYDIRFEVRSLESLDWLYRVRDRYRTVLDVAGIFPWEFEQNIREGNFRRDFQARFDQRNRKAITTEGTFDVPPYVHDIVSAFYYVRTLDLGSMPKGSVIQLQNFFDRQTYDLGVRILGRQTVEVQAGTFRCIVIEPLIREGGLFKSEGRILIWLTDDERKIPVKVSTKIPIGTIDAELTGYSGLRGPLSARIAQPSER
ncbi:MAG: DUF3108 domain-containing protein [Bacteroidota bacterium]|nr:DUF3108 domain-containing protein [Candidatus Kapabacteria bacterium]MCS7302859.1 DUF3108 domain-containing protein [Candidatus Kapabacteria bacterium]MCX7937164.1 DUF3108 domain-containing protein [Chlorobiota bacterium]MDW8075241.1 DUF3108 domain-containing protein [Bacteroidota bacterium]MDW8271854.1 DUF3108 domain-containing protein [Bacteroidota bacterium]